MGKGAVFIVTLLALSCQSVDSRSTAKGPSFNKLKSSILAEGPTIEKLSQRGPFEYEEKVNFPIRLSADDILATDLFLSKHNDYAPLLIFQHGNLASKDYHEYQARLAASWGFHALVVSQTNINQWIKNGHNLVRLVSLLRSWPETLGSRFNPNEIILIGHSFGGSAVAIAAGSSIDVAGVIFLDPALYSPIVKKYVANIKAPALLLGADPKVFMSRKRQTFYSLVPKKIAEVSFAGATHNDAQYPSQFMWDEFFLLVPKPQEERQKHFAAGIVLGSFAFVSPNGNEIGAAWKAFVQAKKEGIIAAARRK